MFAIELVLKLWVLRPSVYMMYRLNVFDFIIVIATTVSLAIDIYNGTGSGELFAPTVSAATTALAGGNSSLVALNGTQVNAVVSSGVQKSITAPAVSGGLNFSIFRVLRVLRLMVKIKRLRVLLEVLFFMTA